MISNSLDTSLWLFSWLMSNIAMTLYNKYIMILYPSAPWLLTTIQMGATLVCLVAGHYLGLLSLRKIPDYDQILKFSFLFTMNIYMSTYSLSLVSVPVHQGIRALSPLITIILNFIYLNDSISLDKILSITPIVIGVILTTSGDYAFSIVGTIICLAATTISCLKGILTHHLQKSFETLDLLLYNSAFAFIFCLLISIFRGEYSQIYDQFSLKDMIALGSNGALAFIVNMTSFIANKKTSALTMSVAGNLKHVTTVLISVVVFHTVIGMINGLGIAITFFGGLAYGMYRNNSPLLPMDKLRSQ